MQNETVEDGYHCPPCWLEFLVRAFPADYEESQVTAQQASCHQIAGPRFGLPLPSLQNQSKPLDLAKKDKLVKKTIKKNDGAKAVAKLPGRVPAVLPAPEDLPRLLPLQFPGFGEG